MKWDEIFRMAGVVYHGNWHAFLPADITGEMGRMGSCTRQSADPGVYKAEKEEAPVIEVLEKTWTAQSVVSVKEMVRAREYDGTDLTEKVKVQIQGQVQADTFCIKKEGDYQAQAVVVSDKTGLRTEKKFQIVIEEGGKSEIR